MSYAVERWVWEECTVEDREQRDVLLAIAWHCTTEDGFGARPELRQLSRMVRLDRKTVAARITQLEDAGELVVWRAPKSHKGRRPTNRYAVAMGRALDDVRRLESERHRPPAPVPVPPGPARASTTGTSTARSASADRGAATRVRPRGSHGGATGEPRGTPTLADPPDTDTDTRRRRAAPASPAGARGGPDESVVERVAELRALVEAAGVRVPWDFSPQQAAIIAAQVVTCGARALADEALTLYAAKGPPRSARAWLTAWEILPDPRSTSAPPMLPERRPCGECDRHLGGAGLLTDESTGRTHKCPQCHPSARMPAPF